MKKLLTLLLILTTGCQALATNAEANLTEARTEQIEVQSDATTIAALVAELRERDNLDQAIIDALLTELEAGRASHQQTVETLADLLAEQSNPSVSPWVIIGIIVIVGFGAGMWFRRGPGRVVIMYLPPGTQPMGALPYGEQWSIELPQDVNVDRSVEPPHS